MNPHRFFTSPPNVFFHVHVPFSRARQTFCLSILIIQQLCVYQDAASTEARPSMAKSTACKCRTGVWERLRARPRGVGTPSSKKGDPPASRLCNHYGLLM